MTRTSSALDVFINCPFDEDFAPLFKSLVFAVPQCGFRARTAKEMDDGSEPRIEKLYRIIDECRFGIHDLTRTELDPVFALPRFNMPLELGLFLGAKRFGGTPHKSKRCLILDVEQYRYQKFISDISGMDIAAHKGVARNAAKSVRDWLVLVSGRKSVPPVADLLASHDAFMTALPSLAENAGFHLHALGYADFERLVIAWVKQCAQI